MKPPLSTGRRTVSFNMTPMIDVIFLLIIFFLCVNQYEKADSAERVRLPQASSERVVSPDVQNYKPLVINVVTQGEIHIAGQPVPIGQLPGVLEVAQGEMPVGAEGRRIPLEVWIRADRGLPYETVEPLLRSCAEKGIWKVAFKVLTPEQATSDRSAP